MNEAQWNVGINMSPLQLSNPRAAFESYTKPLMNKYLPDLGGILIRADYKTLQVKASPELKKWNDPASSCIIRFHPIYPVAKVNMVVNITVFCPSKGLQVDAVVRVVKHDRLVCRFGDNYSIFVSVPLRGEEAESLPVDPETGEPVKVFTGDTIKLEITRVDFSVTRDTLRLSARVLSVLERGDFAKKKLGLNATDSDQNNEMPEKSKGTKRKKHKDHEEEMGTEPHQSTEETSPGPMTPKKKKKTSSVSKLERSGLVNAIEKVSKRSHKSKRKSHDFLATKPDPDGQSNAYREQLSFQDSQFQAESIKETPRTLKSDSCEATGMKSPDIFSSANESDAEVMDIQPLRQNLLKSERR